MVVTIDSAGRLVIPKELREEAQLRPGVPLDIRVRDGRIEIEPAARRVKIIKRGNLQVAVPVDESGPLTADTVRATCDRLRERGR